MTVPASGPTDKLGAADPAPEEHPRNPLLAALGAGDAAVAAVARAFADALTAAASTRETARQRMADLPTELDELRGRFSGEELRRALEAYRAQVERAYAEFAGRGEEAWERLREQPQVRTAVTTFEATGERVARAGQRFSGRAADAVVDASASASEAVADAGTTAAEVIEDAGDGTAAATRKATGVTPGTAAPRRAPRRSGPSAG